MGWRLIIKTVRGHRYRYWQRSFRVPGSRTPRTESRYIGPVDDEAKAAGALAPTTPKHTDDVVAGIQERDIVKATNKMTGQAVEREVRSVKSNALALVEPTSGIPFKYLFSEWSFAVVKKAGPREPMRFKEGDVFIDAHDGEGMTITKVLAEKGKYILQGTSGSDATVTEAQLLQNFLPAPPAPAPVAVFETELRALYARAGIGPLAGETLPPKPSADDIPFSDEVLTYAERLAGWQRSVDELAAQSKIEAAFAQIRAELELSQPGYRMIPDGAHQHGGMDVHAVPSTFPQWLPDRLRRKKLFDRLMQVLDPKTIAYPTRRSASRLRDLYHRILDRVDYLAGVDTSAIREKIMRAYGQSQPDDR